MSGTMGAHHNFLILSYPFFREENRGSAKVNSLVWDHTAHLHHKMEIELGFRPRSIQLCRVLGTSNISVSSY